MRRNGFTLIEMLVALAIFALAALALLRMEGASIARTADLDRRLAMEVTARNLAAEWMSDPVPPALGDESGMVENAGRRFAWTRRVDAPAALPGTIRIVMSVREAGQPSGGISFELVRAVPQ
jgi:general secretion pathway protein I